MLHPSHMRLSILLELDPVQYHNSSEIQAKLLQFATDHINFITQMIATSKSLAQMHKVAVV